MDTINEKGTKKLWQNVKSPRIASVIALLVMMFFNVLGATGNINNVSQGQISDRFPSVFTPAGYVFSIWSLIYLTLIGFVIYQALPKQQNNERLQKLGYMFVVSSVVNVLWLFCWHYEQFFLSELVMISLLGTLIVCYERLSIGRKYKVPWLERLLLELPFSLYMAWISVATIANTSVFLIARGAQVNSAVIFWMFLILVVTLILAYLMLERRNDYIFPSVLIWAFIGIIVKQWGGQYLLVVLETFAAVGGLVFLLGWKVFKQIRAT